jgi:hypothetical protein
LFTVHWKTPIQQKESPVCGGASVKNVKDNTSLPKRRTTRKVAPKVDFLDAELRAATETALRKKLDELRVVAEVLRSLNAAWQYYGYPPEWLAKIDRYEIAQALRGLSDETGAESELLKMITGLKVGRK